MSYALNIEMANFSLYLANFLSKILKMELLVNDRADQVVNLG